MSLRDDVEAAVRAWNAYEIGNGHAPVIDFDCFPTEEAVEPAESRLQVYRTLSDLRRSADRDADCREILDAHLAYLKALMGERPPLAEYVFATQGCRTAGWDSEYIQERGHTAQTHLAKLGISWDEKAAESLAEAEGALTPDEAADAIRAAATDLEAAVRAASGATASYELSIETTSIDEYWTYWLDGAGQSVRLRLNLRKAKFTRVRARQFALHEVLGHGLQSASLSARCRAEDVPWVRLLSVHLPHQVMLEGLAQALPLFVAAEDEQLVARVRLDHYLQLVRAELHLAINSGRTVDECAQYAGARVPFWTDEEIASELSDRSANPLLRSYLWAYPAGLDWFVALAEDSSTDIGRVLHAAYRAPLTPAGLAALWPAGPEIGGTPGIVRLRQPAVP